MITHGLWNSMAGRTKKVKEKMCIYHGQTLYIHNHQISPIFELCNRDQINEGIVEFMTPKYHNEINTKVIRFRIAANFIWFSWELPFGTLQNC